MKNSCLRSDATVSLLVTFLLLPVALFGISFRVEAVEGDRTKSKPESTLQNPIRAPFILVKGTSWTALGTEPDMEYLKLAVSLKNTGNKRVEYFGVRVRYKSKIGESLGGRDHYIRKFIDPGQTIQVSLPESRPPDADEETSVTAQAIYR